MIIKLILFQFILCIVFLDFSYGQTDKLIHIPVLKETVRLDSLIERYIDKRRISYASLSKISRQYNEDIEALLKDSCLEADISKGSNPGEVEIFMRTRIKTALNEDINLNDHGKFKFEYGCFYYKGNNVFVCTRDVFDWLFSKTDRTQTYNFIYYANKNQNYPKEPRTRDVVAYLFQHNAFSETTPNLIIINEPR